MTYNTWHGLTGGGLLSFGELEPEARRLLRFQLQDREISDLDPDLVFLQELNPVAARSKTLARHLDADEVHQADQSGIKFLGRGIPSNLCTGLSILARRGLGLKKLASIRLSGGFGRSGDYFSLQFAEVRYALIAEIRHRDWGHVLLCNAHLHHGFELTPSIRIKLDEAFVSGVISLEEREAMEAAMHVSRLRRMREIERLFDALEPLAKGMDGVLMGGDFNSTPDGIAYQTVVSRGFIDVHETVARKRGERAQDTWEPARNIDNHRFAENFVYTVPVFGRPEVKAILRAYDLESRRIDFLFARGSVEDGIASCRLWGESPINGPFNGLILSDHFGVEAEWRIPRQGI